MTTKRPRDSYRQRVFDAEKKTSAKMVDSSKIDRLIKRIDGTSWASKNIVHPVGGWSWTRCLAWTPGQGTYLGRLPMGNGPTLTDLTFAHALAHHMTPADVALHGPEFCRNFIEATRKWIDEPRAEELRQHLKECGAKMKTWSPEAREKARARYNERHFHSAVHELKAMLDDLRSSDEPATEEQA